VLGVGGSADDRRAAASAGRDQALATKHASARESGQDLGVSQPLRLLVDTRLHSEELARFETNVVRGPYRDDCAIWVGAIGGDGYGRFWVRRGGGTRIMVRANRYALAAAQDGEPLAGSVRALHGCDNTVCVRVSQPGDLGLLHVVGASQRDNLKRMGRARRGGVRPVVRRGSWGLAQRRARAVALRDAVRDGWDADAVAQALLTLREPTLW